MNEMNTYTYLLLNRGRPLGLHNKQQGSLNFYSHLKEELDDFWLENYKTYFSVLPSNLLFIWRRFKISNFRENLTQNIANYTMKTTIEIKANLYTLTTRDPFKSKKKHKIQNIVRKIKMKSYFKLIHRPSS